MINIPPVGSKCKVTFPSHYPNYSFIIEVLDTNVKKDGRGTILYKKLSDNTVRIEKEVKKEEIQVWLPEKRDRFGTIMIKGHYQTRFRTVYSKLKPYTAEYVEREINNPRLFVDSFSVVDKNWFDEELTGRKVEILN
jgi:hypothetical protein